MRGKNSEPILLLRTLYGESTRSGGLCWSLRQDLVGTRPDILPFLRSQKKMQYNRFLQVAAHRKVQALRSPPTLCRRLSTPRYSPPLHKEKGLVRPVGRHPYIRSKGLGS